MMAPLAKHILNPKVLSKLYIIVQLLHSLHSEKGNFKLWSFLYFFFFAWVLLLSQLHQFQILSHSCLHNLK